MNNPNRNETRAMEPQRSREMGARGESPLSMSPFSFMQRMMGDMDRLFDGFPTWRSSSMSPRHGEGVGMRGAWIPQVDVFERNDKLIVHADLAGLRREDLRVTTDDGVLTIAGERRHEHEHEAGGVHRCERSYGSFHRAIALPEGVDAENIQASFDNGVLEVSMPLPKSRGAKGRNIPIGASPITQGGVKH